MSIRLYFFFLGFLTRCWQQTIFGGFSEIFEAEVHFNLFLEILNEKKISNLFIHLGIVLREQKVIWFLNRTIDKSILICKEIWGQFWGIFIESFFLEFLRGYSNLSPVVSRVGIVYFITCNLFISLTNAKLYSCRDRTPTHKWT